MQATFDDIQQAFVEGKITLLQFIEILIDNYGMRQTQRILDYNLKIAIQKEQCTLSKTEK